MTPPLASGRIQATRRPLRGGIVLVTLLGVAAYLLASVWPALFPRPQFDAVASAGCDLNIEPCVAEYESGHAVRLTLEPSPLTGSRPLRLQVMTTGMAPSHARAVFSGVDMNMGRLEIPLKQVGAGEFVAETSLPACIRRQMTWRVLISLDDPNGLHRATFTFDVNRH